MNDAEIRTLEQVRRFLKSSLGIKFKGLSRDEKYKWITGVIDRFRYFSLMKKDRGVARAYVVRMTGFSQSQLTRLIAKKHAAGEICILNGKRNSFKNKYKKMDKELLAETDNLHGRMSGPATRKIFARQYHVYGDKRFESLKDISSSHIYNLRVSRTYKLRAHTFARTKSVQVSIGIRRKPNSMGKPGYLRVDTVHQGDRDGEKGVYHINLIDEVTQWEIVICVEKISEAYLLPVLKEALKMFPFRIFGLNLHLIVDNYGTHKHRRVKSWLRRHSRFHLHFIPTSSSWVNMVERWFRELTDKRIRRGSFQNVSELIAAIKNYIDGHNQNPQVFVWSAPVERILAKVAKCKEALDALD